MDRFRSLNRWLPAPAALLAVMLGTITGCGSGQGEVSGTVRYNGLPLPSGTIQFLGADGIPHAGKIQPDGTFSVPLPAGAAKVIISCVDEARMEQITDPSAGRRAALTSLPSGSFSLIPQRYADWEASGLTVQVKRGKTVQDFELIAN